MCIIKFKIDVQSFKTKFSEEMGQKITYSGKSLPFFEFVLSKSVGGIDWYKDWEEIDGYYYCEVRFFSKMILDKLRKLTKNNEIFRESRVDIFMTTEDKYGYYQMMNGSSQIGFSIKDQKPYYEKLVNDLNTVREKDGTFKINLTEIVRVNSVIYVDELDETTERKVYSFFVNEPEYDYSLLSNAISTLKDVGFH